MRHLPPRFSLIGGAFALLLLVAGCASNQPAQTAQTAKSEADMLIASGFQVRTPNQTQRDKLQSLTAGQISEIQAYGLTLFVYPDWPTGRVLIGGPKQYQTYQLYRASRNLPFENPPQVYRGPSFDWRNWYSGVG
jgi:hypothetical protein